MFKLQGTVKVVKSEEVISDKFKKREFVITDDSSMYPQDVSFQLAQDKCSLADGIKEGQQIEVYFNIRGREWTSPKGEVKYFNTLDCWKLQVLGESAGVPVATVENVAKGDVSDDGSEPDLPF